MFFIRLLLACCVGLYCFITNKQPLQANAIPQGEIHIIVRKPPLSIFTGTLEVWDEHGLWKSYPINVGAMPGDKILEGDKKTPEGVFYICTKHLGKFGLSLGLSYPSLDHAMRGLTKNIIDRPAYIRIKRAVDQKEKPPWDTPLGGGIMIHGGGLVRLWKIFYAGTYGCVRMEDADISEIYPLAKIGMRVTILP